MTQHRQAECKKLMNKLKKKNTHPGIRSAIQSILLQGFKEALTSQPPHSDTEKLIQMAVQDQQDLGESSLAKGLISTKWHIAQNKWLSQNNQRQTEDTWAKQCITYLQNYTYQVWMKQNEFTHGKDKESYYSIQKQKLKEQVKLLYNQPRDGLNGIELQLFNLPLAKRQRSSIASMTTWISTTETILQRNLYEQTQTKEGILKWLYPRPKKWLEKMTNDDSEIT